MAGTFRAQQIEVQKIVSTGTMVDPIVVTGTLATQQINLTGQGGSPATFGEGGTIFVQGSGGSATVYFRKGDGTDVNLEAGAGGGESNTASNVGTGGVGVFKQKSGVDLEFKKINAGSSKVTITDDTGNDEVDIDVADASTSQAGAIEIATQAEVDAGSSTTLAVTPSTLANTSILTGILHKSDFTPDDLYLPIPGGTDFAVNNFPSLAIDETYNSIPTLILEDSQEQGGVFNIFLPSGASTMEVGILGRNLTSSLGTTASFNLYAREIVTGSALGSWNKSTNFANLEFPNGSTNFQRSTGSIDVSTSGSTYYQFQFTRDPAYVDDDLGGSLVITLISVKVT